MIPAFEFSTATRIRFGPGCLTEVGGLAANLGSHALVVTGRDSSRAKPLQQILTSAGLESTVFPVDGEPEVGTVQRGVTEAKAQACDLVISFGGGSAIDAGKAIAALLTNRGELTDFLEIIGRNKALEQPSAPFIAIPTTAGTGSEVTRNAVLASPEHRVKVSLRSPLMLARLALIDPELTYDLPPEITASTGMDALTQLIEPFVCLRANPMTDALCFEGLGRVARSLSAAFQDASNAAARQDMSLASLFGGLALANAGLGAVHGFAGPLGGMFKAPHGALCAALLPHVMETNVIALRARQPKAEALDRYQTVARLLTQKSTATVEDGIDWVRQLVADLHIPALSTYGITRSDIPELVDKAATASSMKPNPIALSPEELSGILEPAL
jgi:alcohol dehydrogenase class IV